MKILETRGLSVGHGATTVARDLDLEVAPGEIVGIFGPNGAGKTTTLLTLAGCLPSHGGTVTALGSSIGRSADARALARSGVRLVPEDRGLFRQLTVRENLILGLPGRRAGKSALDEALDALPKLRTLLSRRAGLLSGGEQQQLALARALLGRPKLLLVDEMSQGLAPTIALGLLRMLKDRAAEHGTSVLLVEQHVPMALEVVDRAYVFGHGRVMFAGTAAELAGSPDVLAAVYLGAGPEPEGR
ncbi:ABC transporter ATP-binding protein [Actinomadura sp. NPDC048394]|uniref:ABC transporter ATP-binding protein n=1 Tax=Actinomadura sp. NPDC048394 TaxID=3158223 RepID=UPI0033C91014